MRFYFDGDNLKQIMIGNYRYNPVDEFEGERTIINVVEFSDSPDQKYLSLPEELEEVE